jgi:hypothetical protein
MTPKLLLSSAGGSWSTSAGISMAVRAAPVN